MKIKILFVGKTVDDRITSIVDDYLKRIKNIDIPIIFISHDEDLIENCANVIIHIEQLMRKQKPKISIEKLDYENYVENRGNTIERQERIAKKQREEFDKKQRRNLALLVCKDRPK